MDCNFIIYVRDQNVSTDFYQSLLDMSPILNAPGMTEFRLSDHCKLGLMPELGIKRLLGDSIIDPEKTNGHSRAEIYLSVEDPKVFWERAIQLGAKALSPLSARDWGDEAGYIADPDGHVVAFARSI